MTALARALLPWFERHGRHDLPWQRDRDPYKVWVSEIMLQQTQVATVIPYFERFITSFPDVATLARAPLDAVLALWSGLGYYARARNLHRAAAVVLAEHRGRMPRSFEALEALPGIGRSTAGAILSLAHGERYPILDGNVRRVLARVHAIEGSPSSPTVERELWHVAESHLPQRRLAEYTQALMDLGATLCTRSHPLCAACPLASDCLANERGLQERLPTPRTRARRTTRRRRALVVQDRSGAVLLERRPPSGIWGGLFSLPELESEDSAREWCERKHALAVLEESALAPIAHAFTHFDLVLEPALVAVERGGERIMEGEGWLWYNGRGGVAIGIAAPIRTLLERLASERPLRAPAD